MAITGMVAFASVGTLKAIAVWQQVQDTVSTPHSNLLLILLIAVAAALIFQVIILAAMGIAALKAIKVVTGIVEEVKGKAMPLIAKGQSLVETSHDLVTDLTPKIKEVVADLTPKIKTISTSVTGIVANVEHISGVAKDKVNEFSPTVSAANDTAREATEKARQQVERVNGMVSHALTTVGEMGASLHHGITAPGREIAAMVSGVKTSLDHLIDKTKGFGNGIDLGSMFKSSKHKNGKGGGGKGFDVTSIIRTVSKTLDFGAMFKSKPKPIIRASYVARPALSPFRPMGQMSETAAAARTAFERAEKRDTEL